MPYVWLTSFDVGGVSRFILIRVSLFDFSDFCCLCVGCYPLGILDVDFVSTVPDAASMIVFDFCATEGWITQGSV